MSYIGSNGVIPSWVSLQGLQNGVLHALAQICWSESLNSRRKKLWDLRWSYFCLRQEPNLTNKHLKCLCVVPFFIGKSHVPPGFPPPPAVFSRRAKRPWNPSSLRIITPGTSGSFGGVEAVDSDGVQLRRCGYKFDKRNSCMMEIEDIEKWWNDEFFSQVHGVLFVFCEASQTTSHQLRVSALERTRRCCNLRTTWNTIRHWTILRLGKRKDSTSNLLTCAYLDDWNSSGRIRAFVSTMFRLVKSVRCAGSLTFTG